MTGRALLCLSILGSAASAQDPASLAQGLVGYWKMDEAAGPALDSSGNGIDATWVGPIVGVAPNNPKISFSDPACAQLDGSCSFLGGTDPRLDMTGDLTIAMWINPSMDAVAVEQGLMSKGFSPVRNYTFFRSTGNALYLQCFTNGGQILNMTGFTKIPSNVWTHVAASWRLGGGKLYATIWVNGVVDRALTVNGTPEASADPLTIADTSSKTFWHAPFPGLMDEVRLYDRELTAGEMTMLASGLGPVSPPAAPASIGQFDPTVSTVVPVPAGGVIAGPTMEAHATLSSATAGDVRLAIEVKPVDVAFTGVADATGALVPTGTTATVTATGLVQHQVYHWRVQAVDPGGRTSAWVGPGGRPDFVVMTSNALPVLSGLRQLHPLTGQPLAPGALRYDADAIVVEGTSTDGDNDSVLVQFEIRRIGTAFLDQATSGSALASAGVAVNLREGLEDGEYHWQARTGDAMGAFSAWGSFGSNAETAADFTLRSHQFGSTNARFGCGLSSGAGTGWTLLPLALGLLLRRR